MRRALSVSGILAGSFAALLLACGAEDPETTNAGGEDPAESSSGNGSSSGSSGSSGSEPDIDRDAGPSDAGPPEDFDASPFDAGPGGEGQSCEQAEDLGTLSGDAEGTTLTATGTCGQWVRLRALETSTGAIGSEMSVKFTLISPASQNYDLFVYFDPELDALECNKLQASGIAPAGRADEVRVAWGEGWFPNNADDSRTLNVEIRGECSAQGWTLQAEGKR